MADEAFIARRGHAVRRRGDHKGGPYSSRGSSAFAAGQVKCQVRPEGA